MSSKEPNQFYIDRMASADTEAVNFMQRQSWLDTYVNDDYGVTRQWIEQRNARLSTPEMDAKRKRNLTNPNIGAWVARDTEGKVIGVLMANNDSDGTQEIGSLYVAKDWHGRGVASELMKRALGWLDSSRPIELGVVTYNERAKAFYRKWGFMEVPNSETLFADKIPEIKMIRKGDE